MLIEHLSQSAIPVSVYYFQLITPDVSVLLRSRKQSNNSVNDERLLTVVVHLGLEEIVIYL